MYKDQLNSSQGEKLECIWGVCFSIVRSFKNTQVPAAKLKDKVFTMLTIPGVKTRGTELFQ